MSTVPKEENYFFYAEGEEENNLGPYIEIQ